MSVVRHEQNKVFSKVVEANGFVMTSGIVADDSKLDIKGQTEQTLAEIDRLLALGGTDKSKIVSTMIWLTDIRHRDGMNEVWFEWTGGENMPVRACVEAPLASPGLLVEIQVTAVK